MKHDTTYYEKRALAALGRRDFVEAQVFVALARLAAATEGKQEAEQARPVEEARGPVRREVLGEVADWLEAGDFDPFDPLLDDFRRDFGLDR